MATVLSQVTNAGTVTLTTTAETAVLVHPVMFSGSQKPIHIFGTLVVTASAATTGATVRIRQGSGTGGAIVASYPVENVAASGVVELGWDFEDASLFLGGPSGGQYTVTLQMAGANASSTIAANDANSTVEQVE